MSKLARCVLDSSPKWNEITQSICGESVGVVPAAGCDGEEERGRESIAKCGPSPPLADFSQ